MIDEFLQVFNQERKALPKKINRKNKADLPTGEYSMIVLSVIENSKNEYLMQLTSKEKGNVLALAGGYVLFNETGEKAIIRELREEMSLEIKSDIAFVGYKLGKKIILEIYYIREDIDIDKLVLKKDEVEKVFWIKKNEILNLIKNNKLRNTNIEAFKMLKNL